MNEAVWAIMKVLITSYGQIILLAFLVMVFALLMQKIYPTWEETLFYPLKLFWHKLGVWLGDEKETSPPPAPPIRTQAPEASSQNLALNVPPVQEARKCQKDPTISECQDCSKLLETNNCPHEKFGAISKKTKQKLFSDED